MLMGGATSPQAQAVRMQQQQQQRVQMPMQGGGQVMMSQQQGGMRAAPKLMPNGSMQHPMGGSQGFGGLAMPKLGGPSGGYSGVLAFQALICCSVLSERQRAGHPFKQYQDGGACCWCVMAPTCCGPYCLTMTVRRGP